MSGGVAKTTMTMNLGYLLSQREKQDGTKYRVLMVDMDAQASLTAFNGLNPFGLEKSIYNALTEQTVPIVYKIKHGYNIAPANLELSVAELELAPVIRREDRLKNCLTKVHSKYDVILIDCAPGSGLLSIMCMVAADYLMIPIQTEFKSVQATMNLLQRTYKILKEANPKLMVRGVMPTMSDNTTQCANALVSIQNSFEKLKGNSAFKENKVYDPIPRRTAVANASAARQPLAIFDPKSPVLDPMNAIVDHMLEVL